MELVTVEFEYSAVVQLISDRSWVTSIHVRFVFKNSKIISCFIFIRSKKSPISAGARIFLFDGGFRPASGLISRFCLLRMYFTLVSCVAYSSTLKMEAMCSFETSVEVQRTTQRYIPYDKTLYIKNVSIYVCFHWLFNDDFNIENI
jgi:hypothetical protein